MTKCRKGIIIFSFCIILILNLILIPNTAKASTYTQTIKQGIDNFPESYRAKLQELKELYPSWTFSAYYTGISWNTFITQERSLHLRNSIKTSNSLWLDSCGLSASGYSCASAAILKYYADPRNFLDESGILQFLEMTYNSSSQTEDGVKSIISSTFMNKDATYTNPDGTEVTMPYCQIIMEAARESKMSPYSIAIKIRQEVGVQGSNSVSGYYVAKNGTVYEGYYNFFNYGAYDEGDAIANGLEYAKKNGWTNPYIAIIEGAKLMANSYTNAGQNTAYFYKWDVVGNEPSQLFSHQYMTNIQDPSSQAKSLFNTYAKNGLLNTPLNFIIPIYDDMPQVNNLPTTIDTSLNTSYYLTGSEVRLRGEPSTSAGVLATLNKYEVVKVLELSAGTANDLQWSKVELANGTIGYVASKYLSPCSTGISDSIAKVEGTMLKVVPDQKPSQIAKQLSATSFKVTKPDSTPIGPDDPIGTGYKYIINNTTYTVVVIGDINGDATINSGDLLLTKKHLLETAVISEDAKKSAMDINKDGTINSGDLLLLKKHLLGTNIISSI